MDELEKVVKELEGGDLSLDRSLELFERGMSLSDICRKQLEEDVYKRQGLNMAVTLPLVAEVCCKGTGQQLKPFFHWCVCPLVSMAPVRRLNIGEARAALP